MLKFEFWSIFEAVANVLILFVLLRIFLFKPLNKMKNERTRIIQDNIDDTEKAKAEAEELRSQYEGSISEAKEKANEIIMKAHEDAESEKAAIIERSKEEADEIISSAGKAAENERRRVIQQAQSQIADLAIQAASKVVGANLDDEKNRRLVDQFLSEQSAEEGDK
ncbi:MAG TPA: ATP synthase F0 subunit B [Ruminococcus sp.]|nr:ATP synthase F0 subunit B [Ruminococcus sp.]